MIQAYPSPTQFVAMKGTKGERKRRSVLTSYPPLSLKTSRSLRPVCCFLSREFENRYVFFTLYILVLIIFSWRSRPRLSVGLSCPYLRLSYLSDVSRPAIPSHPMFSFLRTLCHDHHLQNRIRQVFHHPSNNHCRLSKHHAQHVPLLCRVCPGRWSSRNLCR